MGEGDACLVAGWSKSRQGKGTKVNTVLGTNQEAGLGKMTLVSIIIE